MKKFFVAILLVSFLLTTSGAGLAANHSVFIEPAHGGLDYGFNINGTLEKELNLQLALDLAGYIEESTLSRTTDRSVNLTQVIEQIKEIQPEIILSIQHHGKQAVFIEYNPAASRLAYQLGTYFAIEDIPFRFLRFKGAYLFAQPEPVIVLILSPEIAEQMDLALIAEILQGLE